MIYVHWIVLLVYGIAVVGTMLRVLMDNRQPVKTMAWLLVLSFLPLLGIILYFFFGQNTRKERYISEQSLDQLTKRSMLGFVGQRDLRLPDEHQGLIRLFTNQSLSLPFKDNVADIYTNGYEFFPVFLQELSRARHHIHLCTYIFADDALGYLVADVLIDKAREGVEVRVIYDDVGCWNVKGRFFERMREAGVEVQPFMPVTFPAFTGKVNYRNHRKLCVVDGRTAFIGGMNIALRYVKGTGRQAWRDTHLRLRGGIVYAVQRAFLVDWYFVDRTLISGARYYPALSASLSSDYLSSDPKPSGELLAQIVTSSPVSPWPDIMQGYVRILHEAKQYVYMETPYFLPTEPVLFAMRTAALAGIDVRLMVPKKGDARLVQWAGRSYLTEALEAGVKVYLYEAGFNHSKLLVADDSLSTCGSTNIDFRSFENNFESNVFFFDREMALRMKKVFLDDQEHCELMADLPQKGVGNFLRRLWESVIRMLSPLL